MRPRQGFYHLVELSRSRAIFAGSAETELTSSTGGTSKWEKTDISPKNGKIRARYFQEQKFLIFADEKVWETIYITIWDTRLKS